MLITGFATILVVVTSGALAAMSPLLLKSLVDALGKLHPGTSALASASLFGVEYLLVLIAGRTLADVRPLLSGTLSQRLHSRLTRRFFQHVARLPMSYLVKRRSGELLHSLELGSAGAQLVIAHLATSLLPVLVEVVTMTAVLIHLDQPALVGVFGAAAMAYIAIFSAGARRMTTAAHAVSAASLDMAAQLGDGVANIETLRCFAAEEHVGQRLAATNAVLERRWSRLYRLNLTIALSASATFAVAMAACLVIAASAVDARAMTTGGFVLSVMYMLQMVSPLESLGSAARDLARALGYLQPLIELLAEPLSPGAIGAADAKPVGATLPAPAALAVRIEDLHFAYDPDRPVLKGVDFEVPAGSMTAIVGRSGSGKSSLARLLMRLYAPQQGRILLDGRDIDQIGVDELRGTLIGLVPQETALLHETIAGNIAIGRPSSRREDVYQAACTAQLEGLLRSLSQGLDTPVGERGMQLSGGERQRVGIARALLRRPGLYVLDEPTSMLDTKTERELLMALRSLAEGATTIVIAHRLSTIIDADEIVVLDGGRVIERGGHQQLLANDGAYARMWNQQMGLRQ